MGRNGNQTLRGGWAELAEKVGGVAALAAALGVTRQTVWRWNRGVVPCGIVVMHVTEWARRRGVGLEWGK